jgi:hypothetical protein
MDTRIPRKASNFLTVHFSRRILINVMTKWKLFCIVLWRSLVQISARRMILLELSPFPGKFSDICMPQIKPTSLQSTYFQIRYTPIVLPMMVAMVIKYLPSAIAPRVVVGSQKIFLQKKSPPSSGWKNKRSKEPEQNGHQASFLCPIIQ